MDLATFSALKKIHFNVFGQEYNPKIDHVFSETQIKKTRDFFFKSEKMREFLKGCERKDEKVIFSSVKTIEKIAGERVVRQGSYDRTLYFVASGELMEFNSEATVYHKEGAVFGMEQILFNKMWDTDLICSKSGLICCIKWEELLDMQKTNAVTSAKLKRRIVNFLCHKFLNSRRNEFQSQLSLNGIREEDLFIDLKLDFKKNNYGSVFGTKVAEKKGQEF